MKLSNYNSSKITILYSVLILMVLYIHGHYDEAIDFPVAFFVQLMMGTHGLCAVANLLFFCISGFLFFNGIKSAKDCFPKMRKRVKTLLIPYVIWNIVFVLWYVVLELIPGVERFVNNDYTEMFSSVPSALMGMFGRPINGPLWFIRNLMLYVLFSPLIYYFVKFARGIGVLALFIIGMFNHEVYWMSFFVLGAYIAICHSLDDVDCVLSNRIFILCCSVYVITALYRSLWAESYAYSPNSYFAPVFGICALVSVWKGYDIIVKGRLISEYPFWKRITGYSFFVYLCHTPSINVLKKLTLLIFGTNEISLIVLFLVNPIIMMFVTVITAKIIRRFVPRLYSVLVGGR